jgi:hypothetical protein
LFCVFVERICSERGDEEDEDEDEKKRGKKWFMIQKGRRLRKNINNY